jgi:hypothetical protein
LAAWALVNVQVFDSVTAVSYLARPRQMIERFPLVFVV